MYTTRYIVDFHVLTFVCLFVYVYRAVAMKVDLLITGGSGGVDKGRPSDAVGASLSNEISQIKATESNILHQLADLRYIPIIQVQGG